MKKYLLIVLLFVGLKSQAQDTTVVYNFTIQLQHAVILMPNLFVSGDSSKFNLYVRLNTSIKPLSKNISVTTPIAISYISITNILAMYLNIASTPAGYSLLTSFQSTLAPYRAANSNLDTQCKLLESNYISQKNNYYIALLTLAQGY